MLIYVLSQIECELMVERHIGAGEQPVPRMPCGEDSGQEHKLNQRRDDKCVEEDRRAQQCKLPKADRLHDHLLYLPI